MIRKVSFAAFAFLTCTGAAAATDSRIRTLSYDANQIVRILGKPGIQSTIEFAPDERIENVAVGDSAAWQITPNRRASLLFVKPLNARSRTNMTVVTDRRTYMFDLVAGERSSTPVYALKFSYPNEKKADAARPAQQQAVGSGSAQQATLTAEKLHFDWKSKGSDKLLPARVFDDGSSLYLAWDRENPLPAILTQSEDRKEGPVNYRISGEYIVISPIPQNLVLRYGKRVATLWATRRIMPQQPVAPNSVSRMAAVPPTPIQQPEFSQAEPAQAAPAPTPQPRSTGAVRLANVTSLYSDKLTDTHNER
jgi:type IV secretion system protein VirB9